MNESKNRALPINPKIFMRMLCPFSRRVFFLHAIQFVLLGKENTRDFFQKTHCDRCGKQLTVRITSMFNTDTICLDCKKREETHPAYERARQTEQDAVRRGDLNFPGFGLPPDLK